MTFSGRILALFVAVTVIFGVYYLIVHLFFRSDAYIESILCTTCNECTNLNGAMFKYDRDKQAYLADLSAGTFEEFVRAAELCPAK